MKLLTHNNSKLKAQFIFDLPVSHDVCGRRCPGCYALKAQLRFPATLEKRNRMLLSSKRPDFANNIIAELNNAKQSSRIVRVHSSGEFYSQPYVDSWHTVVTALPTFTFYAFTKRLADFDFSRLSAMPNFILINSLQFGPLNYAPIGKLPIGAFICPSTLGKPVICGVTCTYCMTKTAQTNGVCFVKH